MIKNFILTATIIVVTNASSPAGIGLADGDTRDVVNKYIKNIPDIENHYVINENLSKAISRYYGGKISMLPLYKISLTIDRNPIKIPWTIPEGNDTDNIKGLYKETKTAINTTA